MQHRLCEHFRQMAIVEYILRQLLSRVLGAFKLFEFLYEIKTSKMKTQSKKIWQI